MFDYDYIVMRLKELNVPMLDRLATYRLINRAISQHMSSLPFSTPLAGISIVNGQVVSYGGESPPYDGPVSATVTWSTVTIITALGNRIYVRVVHEQPPDPVPVVYPYRPPKLGDASVTRVGAVGAVQGNELVLIGGLTATALAIPAHNCVTVPVTTDGAIGSQQISWIPSRLYGRSMPL